MNESPKDHAGGTPKSGLSPLDLETTGDALAHEAASQQTDRGISPVVRLVPYFYWRSLFLKFFNLKDLEGVIDIR